MFICRVVGSVVSTFKHSSYQNQKLLLVRPTTADGKLLSGTMVAVDAAEAGPGDWVLVVAGGGANADVLDLGSTVPVREVVVGVIDRVEMGVA